MMGRKERIKELLEQAAGLGPVERSVFLARECGDDEDMRREIEELLAADENSSRLADSVAFRVGAEDETLGKVLGGQYVIKRKLGEGGMGQVYLAQEKGIPREVAIKIFEQGFNKEVEALGRIKSNHVVKIFNTGETDDGRPFIVMEYLTGQTLADLLKERGRLRQEEIAQLMRKIAEATTELHETKTESDDQGIIHRDLKPSNIMVELRKGSWEVKLFDLGVARLQNPLMSKSTSKHVAVGTPFYMAPEQFHGEGMVAFGCQAKSLKEIISPRTDIYSLGVMGYEMLVGQNPFRDATSPANVAAMQRENRYAEALNRRREIPAAARRAVLKAMAFCPEQRCQKAEEFGEELSKALTARPPSRMKYATVTAVLLLMLLGVGAFVWLPAGALKADEEKPVTRTPISRTPEPEAPRMPEREVTYWFVTQEMRNERLVGEPKIITAEDGLINGWNFKVFFNGKERGYLYLINDGPSAQGRSLQLLFPIPNQPLREERRNNGTSEVAPSQTVEAFDGEIHNVAGTEHLWVIWSINRIPELERLTGYAVKKHEGKINSQSDAEALRAFLLNLKQTDVKYNEQRHAVMRGEGSVLARKLLLRHI